MTAGLRAFATAAEGEELPAIEFALNEGDFAEHLARHAYCWTPPLESPWGAFMPPSYCAHVYIPLLESTFDSTTLIHVRAESRSEAPIPLDVPLRLTGRVMDVGRTRGGRARGVLAWEIHSGGRRLASGRDSLIGTQ